MIGIPLQSHKPYSIWRERGLVLERRRIEALVTEYEVEHVKWCPGYAIDMQRRQERATPWGGPIRIILLSEADHTSTLLGLCAAG